MEQPTDPALASEGPEPEPLPPVCPCGDLSHEPVRVGTTVSMSGPERSLYACSHAATRRYGLGPVS